MKPKVLIIDDEPDIAETLAYILKAKGCDAIIAYDGFDGLSKAIKETPDVILLDIIMPRMDGYEVCELLRNGKSTKSIPIIMLTAKGDTNSILHAREIGADDYILKPFNISMLMNRIYRLIPKSSVLA